MERYLADTSAFARSGKPVVAAALAPLLASGRVLLCAPVAFELAYSARSADDHRALSDRLSSFPFAPTTDADHRRALDVQSALADVGRHRALLLVDALVAAVAEVRELTILHYDADFELIAEITGQGQRWIVPRGSAN